MTPSSRGFRIVRLAGWSVALLSIAACSAEGKKRREKAPEPAPASVAAPAPAPAPATAAPAPAAAAASAPTRRGFDPQRGTGKVQVVLSLPAPLRMGGFEMRATYDASRMHVAEPVTLPALQGYMCASNLAEPGDLRFNCVGLINEDRGGKLATLEVSHAGAAPTAADFTITETKIVDDHGNEIPGARLALAVEPVPAR